MTTATDPVADLLTTAGSLMSEPGTSNPEYDRALVELVRDLGLASDRTVALALLRQHSPHWSEHTTESRTLPLHCPQCGSSESLGTAEILSGWAGATFLRNVDTGEVLIEHDGYTDVHWDGTESVGIHCRACDWGIETYDDPDGEPDVGALVAPLLVCPNCNESNHLTETIERRVVWAVDPEHGLPTDSTPKGESDPITIETTCRNPETSMPRQPCWRGHHSRLENPHD